MSDIQILSKSEKKDVTAMQIVTKPEKKEVTTVLGNDVNTIIRKYSDVAKWDEYRRRWEKARKLEYVPEFPLQIDFELNYSCNFKCSMCTWSSENPANKGKNTWLDFNIYKEIIDEGVNKGLSAIRLNYINEPLVRKDIIKFIQYAKKAGILDIYFSSNGSLLNPKISKELIESGLTRLQVSIDATTKETFEKIRQGGNFNKVVTNVQNFITLRNKMNKELPTIRVNFVKSQHNKHELNDFLEFWKGKVDCIGVQNLINIMDQNKEDIKNKKFNCSQPYNHLTIRYDGSILPCCTFFGAKLPIAKVQNKNNYFMSDVKNLENPDTNSLKKRSISESWHSEEMKQIRELHKKGEYYKNEVCKVCVNSMSHLDFDQ